MANIIDLETVRKQRPSQSQKTRINAEESTVIELAQFRTEKELRDQYEAHERQRRQTTANGHKVLDGERLKRRVPAFRGFRETDVTLHRIAQELDVLKRQKESIVNQMTSHTVTGSNGEERREHDHGAYKRTTRWLREKGYIKE